MRIILAAIEEPLAEAWESNLDGLQDVEVYRGDILHLDVDAVVSPANSFGFMDGGIDLAYSRKFGWGVQQRLQEMITQELLVGSSVHISTGMKRPEAVIVAPTMRVPMPLSETVNPYLATRAALNCSWPFDSVAFPGMGTGVGGVPPKVAAYQMTEAIREFQNGGSPVFKDWFEARDRHRQLVSGGVYLTEREKHRKAILREQA